MGAGERLVRRDEGLHLFRFRRCVGATGLRGVRGRGFLGLRCFRLFLRCGALSLGGRLGLEPGSFPDQALAVGHGPERQGPASIPFRLFELDWFEMMQSPAAERIWLQLLQELGAGRLMVTENDMRMRNIADQILNRMAQAVPDIYIRIVCKLQGIQ